MEEDAPAGVPEWVVTYGDMMSLLLTFFIMLVSLSEIVAEQKYRAVLEAIEKNRGYQTAPVAPPGKNFPANSNVPIDNTTLGSQSLKDDARGGVKTRSSTEGDDLRIRVTDEGVPQLVGTPLEFIGQSLKLTADSESDVLRIARDLSGKPNKVEIRSHCSAEELDPTDGYEDRIALTYARGHAVFELLTRWGIEADRMRITAASDTTPVEPGPDQRVSSDRVEILTTNIFASEYIGPRRP